LVFRRPPSASIGNITFGFLIVQETEIDLGVWQV